MNYIMLYRLTILTVQQSEDYTTGCLLDYDYIKKSL